MNTLIPSNTENALINEAAEKYKKEGHEVIIEPGPSDLPFDLGSYRPSLIARKSANEGFIIEVRISGRQTSIDRIREVAEAVSQHNGWRFLLITGEDTGAGNLLSLEQIIEHREKGVRLATIGEPEAAYLSLWITLEALLRTKAEHALIPIERFPATALIKHLYSQGELSIGQFDSAIELLSIRNHIADGFEVSDLQKPLKALQNLIDDLLSEETPQASCAA